MQIIGLRKELTARAAAIAMLATAAIAASAHAGADPGSWKVDEKTSPLDGKTTYEATLLSNEPLANILDRDAHAALMFSCDKLGFFATVDWPDFVAKDYDQYEVQVRWKVDDGPIQRQNWRATTTAVALMGNGGLSFLKAIADGKRLVIQVPDHHGGQDATFDLSGIEMIYAALSSRNCPP